ncbi:hypothetical protein KHQ81_11945 [Mycoplasmatota bacterium]|nr:hypothetical protein KHQ81_11945 [Mycoplasmatota bacterium]
MINETTPVNYGMGWLIRHRNNKKIVFHDGSAFGYRALLGKSLQDDLTLIILTNCFKSELWTKIYNRCSYIISELSEMDIEKLLN